MYVGQIVGAKLTKSARIVTIVALGDPDESLKEHACKDVWNTDKVSSLIVYVQCYPQNPR
jgi:hypothetical protein